MMPAGEPAQMKPEIERIGRYYDEQIYNEELTRLESLFPVEYAITARAIQRHVAPGATVVEAGVGGGHYSELLARRGCTLHLVDVARRLLTAVTARLRAAGLASQILSAEFASATDLRHLPAASVDAALFLGPFYHLRDPNDRRAAAREAARVLRPAGILLAAGINRLAYLRDMFRPVPPNTPSELAALWEKLQERLRRDLLEGVFVDGYLRDGNVDPEHAAPIGYAHFTTVAEFRELLSDDFDEVALAGVESFSAPWQQRLNDFPPELTARWLDVIEATAPTPEGLAASDHWLFVGRGRA